jgi:hypothetical protein
LAASLTGADVTGAETADEAAPPKLKKDVMSCPSTAFAKSLGQ